MKSNKSKFNKGYNNYKYCNKLIMTIYHHGFKKKKY